MSEVSAPEKRKFSEVDVDDDDLDEKQPAEEDEEEEELDLDLQEWPYPTLPRPATHVSSSLIKHPVHFKEELRILSSFLHSYQPSAEIPTLELTCSQKNQRSYEFWNTKDSKWIVSFNNGCITVIPPGRFARSDSYYWDDIYQWDFFTRVVEHHNALLVQSK